MKDPLVDEEQSLLQNYRRVEQKVQDLACLPLTQGRMCFFGIVVLEILRGICWWRDNIPGYTVVSIHFMSIFSDVTCLLVSFPLFCCGTRGCCVTRGCMGPLMTVVFALSMADFSAFGMFLFYATPRPLPVGQRSLLDRLEATIGVWELALITSTFLQLTLFVCAWRVYKLLRENGLDPPGNLKSAGQHRDVSVLEVVCEPQDLEQCERCRQHIAENWTCCEEDSNPYESQEDSEETSEN